MILLDGRKAAEKVKERLSKEIKEGSHQFTLAVILIGDNPASAKYVAMKQKESEKIGLGFKLHKFEKDVKQEEVMALINKLNDDREVTGMIVQLPLPDHFRVDEILEAIKPQKDVDGLNSVNLGKLLKGIDALYPATPAGIMELFRQYGIELAGKKVTVVGQSNLVGKPLVQMLLNEKATVSVANSKTKDLKSLTIDSEIVISAAGKPNLITGDMIKEGAIVVDVGTSAVEDKIVGDVDFGEVSKKASFITPNPGGVGPMTVAMLLFNVVKAGKYYGN
jgi:methylenetetrahydrofolate dehydrogenase (NADP+)/methenyltetrahydrofolate cyclohydrolase